MKLVQKWMLLIDLMIMSLKSFSQTVIDSTKIQLTKPIAKLVIKDLIKGDGAKQELVLFGDKIKLLEQKIFLKDSVILNLNSKINNFNSILNIKGDQLSLSQDLSKRLQSDLQKQKLKNKITAGAGVIAVITTILLLK
jgi:negative regulator of sigma E activity